jgi:urease accessory protein
MVHVTKILGHVSEPQFRGRTSERLLVDSTEASKRRLRRPTDAGTDVTVNLASGSYLFDGAVLADDGIRIVVVARKPEEALVVQVPDDLSLHERLAVGVRLGHAFGNQHVPVEVEDGEVRIPVTTSREVARATVESLGLPGIAVRFAHLPLGCKEPVLTGHRHTS